METKRISLIEPPDRLRLAVLADVHPDTVRHYLSGRRMQTRTRRRIEAAAKTLGLIIPKNMAADRVRRGLARE